MKTLTLILTLLLFSVIGFAQPKSPRLIVKDGSVEELSRDYSFKQSEDDNPSFQLLPSEEKMLSDAELGNAFQAVGIIAKPSEDAYGLMFFNAQSDFQFDKQKEKNFILHINGDKVFGSDLKVIKKSRVKKLAVEILTVKLSRIDFEKLTAAENIFVGYGDINYNFSDENLRAFRYIQNRINNDIAKHKQPAPSPSSSSGGDVQVKGYYRKDGTYVKPYTRSAPKRKN